MSDQPNLFADLYRNAPAKPEIDACAASGYQPSCPVHGERKPLSPHFDGATYEPEADHERLTGQLARVLDLMRDGQWRTLAEVAEHVQGSEAGVSARLRDLRKPRFGGYDVQKRRRAESLWEYRLDAEKSEAAA